jgi:ATP-dependent DNA helicase RecQ
MGDNVIAFDIPHLHAFAANLSLLRLPVVDTLRLNLLAFPRRLYRHLVKHYTDGGLFAGSATTRCWTTSWPWRPSPTS